MKVRPLYDRIVVRRHDTEAVTKGGIVIPEKWQDKSHRGTVEAVGEGKLRGDGSVRPLAVKVGDVVIVTRHAGMQTAIDDERFIAREDEVLCVECEGGA